MSWDKLVNFQNIFNRADFNYISNWTNIANIELIIDKIITGIEPEIQKSFIQDFLNNLRSFCSWIDVSNIPDLSVGFATCDAELLSVLSYKSDERYRQKWKKDLKNFIYGLSKLTKGIRLAFDPAMLNSTNIQNDQIIRYIFDTNEGLGRKFKFNSRGEHSFANKINLLSKQELEVAMRLLLRPGNQVRTFNKWRDLGAGGTIVRILVEPHLFTRDKVFFLYKSNEHEAYSAQLSISPDKCTFKS